MALATRNLYLVLKARDEASRVIRGFSRELIRSSKMVQAENLRNSAALARAKAAELRALGGTDAQINHQMGLARAFDQQAKKLEKAHRATVRFGNALHVVSSNFITMGAGFAVAGGAGLALLYTSVNVAKDYEKQVRLTATQVDNFKASLEDISAVGLKIARNIAVPFEEIQPALYDILSSTDANLRQATILLEGFSRTAVAGQVSIQEASRGTIPILNAFNIPLEKVNDILDIQFQLVRKGVGTYDQFARVFGRVVPSATRSGQTFQTVAAMLAYLTRNGLSAAMASTSAARALEAMTHPVAIKNMEELGVKVKDLKGNFLPLEQILMSLRGSLKGMARPEAVAQLFSIFKGAGGTIQARRFLEQVLLRPGELEEYIGYLDDMNNAHGAFGNAYDTMAGTVASQTVLLRNKWKILQEAIGRAVTPAFIVLLTWLNKLLDKFNELSPKTKRFIGIGLLIASIFFVAVGGILAFVGAIAGLVASITIAGASFFYVLGAVGAIIGGLAVLTAAIILAWKKSANFRGLIHDMKDTLVEFWKEGVVPAAKKVKEAWDKDMAPALAKFADVMENKILPAARSFWSILKERIVPALKEVAAWVGSMLVKAFSFLGWVINTFIIPAFEKAAKFYNEHKETIGEIITVLVFLGKWFLKIAAVVGGVLAIAFGGPIVAIIGAFILLIAGIVLQFVYFIELVKIIVKWLKEEVPKAWGVVTAAFKKAVDAIWGFLTGLWKDITGFFSDTKTWLVQAGANLIDGLIDGIKSKLGPLGFIAGKVADKIAQYFGGDNGAARTGPLSGKGSMFQAGSAMIKQVESGMKSSTKGVTSSGAGTLAPSAYASMLGVPGTTAPRNNIVQNLTVNTQEINPTRQSAELGFLFAGRM